MRLGIVGIEPADAVERVIDVIVHRVFRFLRKRIARRRVEISFARIADREQLAAPAVFRRVRAAEFEYAGHISRLCVGVYSARGRSCAGSQMVGAASRVEPGAAAREAGPPRRGTHDARRHLRLVNLGLRHHGSERRQGAARST
jgi:hypothetical protein